jgi:homoserine O-acetyltransferase/O-succinyltransferase
MSETAHAVSNIHVFNTKIGNDESRRIVNPPVMMTGKPYKILLKYPFVTEGGFTFPEIEVDFKTWGKLNANRDNAVVICHALTGSAAADSWFSGLFAPGGILDTGDYFVICANVPGSCYGTTGPRSINSDTGKPWGGDFPRITIRDMVNVQRKLLDMIGVNGIEFVIGGSMGGMQALEFGIMDERVRAMVPIAMGMAHSPWAIGISEAQRRAIYSDPNWQGGHYTNGTRPVNGISTARMMAMITYRTAGLFNERFGRNPQDGQDIFQVESYLNYQGQKLAGRFDAVTYVRLTQAMDTHDISRGRGSFRDVLAGVNIPAMIIGIDSDVLYPVSEQKELASMLPLGQYSEITSIYGHDAFLIEFRQLQGMLATFLESVHKTSS